MHSMRNTTNKVPFTANFRIVNSGSEFGKLPLQELLESGKYIGYPWTVKSSKILDEGFTDDASCCPSAYLQNKKMGLFLHLQPGNEENSEEKIAKTFTDAFQSLKAQNNKIGLWLFGGDSTIKESCELHDFIIRLAKDLKLPITSVWGHKRHLWTDAFVSAKEQKCVLNTNMDSLDENYQKAVNKNYQFKSRKIQNISDLKKTYEEVILAKNNTLSFD